MGFAERADERSGPMRRPGGPGREVVLAPGRRFGPPRREREVEREPHPAPERDPRAERSDDRIPGRDLDRVADRAADRDGRPERAPRRDLVPVRAALPAVADHDDPEDGYDPDEDGAHDSRSPVHAWMSFVGQILVAAAGGLAVWLGFQALWQRWPYGAAVAAAGVLVVMLLAGHHIHRRRHPDEPPDMVTVGVLVIVGLVLTISPAAFVLRPI